MRRADRLFQIVNLLQRRRITTAAYLSEKLEVSERTVYRDIADLISSGVAIEGEAGVGYRLKHHALLPPLTFNHEELEALIVGIRMVQSLSAPTLSLAATHALHKIESVLSAEAREEMAGVLLFAPKRSGYFTRHIAPLREAIRKRQPLSITYEDEQGQSTERTLHPLGLFYWGKTWTLLAWCKKREDFRSFRLERIQTLTPLPGAFEVIKGQTLKDFFAFIKRTYPDAHF